jgi:hypothetical protein
MGDDDDEMPGGRLCVRSTGALSSINNGGSPSRKYHHIHSHKHIIRSIIITQLLMLSDI